jgi:hypothetical protein
MCLASVCHFSKVEQFETCHETKSDPMIADSHFLHTIIFVGTCHHNICERYVATTSLTKVGSAAAAVLA